MLASSVRLVWRPDCPQQIVKSGLVVRKLILRPGVPAHISSPIPAAERPLFPSFPAFGAKELRERLTSLRGMSPTSAYNGCMFIVTASPRRRAGTRPKYRETVNLHSSPPQCLQRRAELPLISASGRPRRGVGRTQPGAPENPYNCSQSDKGSCLSANEEVKIFLPLPCNRKAIQQKK